jgi:hypothetical protein
MLSLQKTTTKNLFLTINRRVLYIPEPWIKLYNLFQHLLGDRSYVYTVLYGDLKDIYTVWV